MISLINTSVVSCRIHYIATLLNASVAIFVSVPHCVCVWRTSMSVPHCVCVWRTQAADIVLLLQRQVHLQLRRILPRRKKVLPRNPRHRWRRHIQLAADCSTQAQNSLLIFAIATLEPNVNDFINKCKCSTFSYYQHSFHFIYFRLACIDGSFASVASSAATP